jgi:hypothetical protein
MASRSKSPAIVDSETKPSLRISHIVYGRRKVGNRVEYQVAPDSDQFAIPEKVVLIRWRQRKHLNYVFSGARLGPHVWRALPLLLGSDCAKWPDAINAETVAARRLEHQELIKTSHFRESIPDLKTLEAIFAICGADLLQRLVDRHVDPDVFGVPDLFLYALDKTSGRKFMGRFVEVKKPGEHVSPGQHAEIAFMNALGLHARIIRLIERGRPDS